ncbi:flagellar biosynthesis regulator FlaF [Rheinheimera sp.]|uniref:flagellar biosynthesis regulator FlaF n=1 Tax=Rheinheimera sp. TaxID=1869214 RepID=UPI0027BB1945|nr:flagellar biosynthesis regulator FlaF [Rheinheimera sp.]
MKQAIESYQQHQMLGLNSKTLEQQIFARLCYQLSHCLAGDDEFARLQVMADCRFFWVTLRARLQDDEHPYPLELRQDLISLADIVLHELLKDPQQADLSLVLAISQQLADALKA